ncbi:hypothetical protein ABBQ38_006852 [Trebouxia sp. C0009 RCD-2024]
MATPAAAMSTVCSSHGVTRPVPQVRQAHARMSIPTRPTNFRARPHSWETAYVRGVCRAGKDSQEPPWQRQEGTGPGSPTDTGTTKKEPELTPQDKKGRRTAIITGFISIGFGVAYLLLVSLLDSRGSVLHPPPPEAYGL